MAGACCWVGIVGTEGTEARVGGFERGGGGALGVVGGGGGGADIEGRRGGSGAAAVGRDGA